MAPVTSLSAACPLYRSSTCWRVLPVSWLTARAMVVAGTCLATSEARSVVGPRVVAGLAPVASRTTASFSTRSQYALQAGTNWRIGLAEAGGPVGARAVAQAAPELVAPVEDGAEVDVHEADVVAARRAEGLADVRVRGEAALAARIDGRLDGVDRPGDRDLAVDDREAELWPVGTAEDRQGGPARSPVSSGCRHAWRTRRRTRPCAAVASLIETSASAFEMSGLPPEAPPERRRPGADRR